MKTIDELKTLLLDYKFRNESDRERVLNEKHLRGNMVRTIKRNRQNVDGQSF